MKTPELVLLVRAPLAGTLAPAVAARLGAARAGELAPLLLRATVQLAAAAWPGEVSLYGPAGADHPLFPALATEFHLRFATGAPAGPGKAVHSALCDGIGRHGAAAVLCADVPHLPPVVLEEAFERLARGHCVLGPTDAGGVYLIGTQAPCPALFQGLVWSGPMLLSELAARAAAAAVEFELLPEERAIRDWDDLFLASRRLEILQPYV